MPNALTKDLEIMFENLIEGFDAACVVSREAETNYPNATTMQRSGDIFYRPQNYHANVVTGVDISAQNNTDIIQRQVQSVFRTPDNVRYTLNMLEARDPIHLERMGKAAALRLAAEVEKNLYNKIMLEAGIVVKKVGALTWDDAALAEAVMISRGISLGRARKMFLNAFDWRDVAKALGDRAYMGDLSKDAYTKSRVPSIAGFDTFRTDTQAVLPAIGTVASTQIDGNQSHTVTAMTGDLPTDNRRMTLVVKGANIANIKNGDAFTIVGVNAVHMVDKTDTGQLQTFRVISGAGTANLVITPAIIATGPYQNVTGIAANNANVVFLNTVSKPVNVFWADGAVTLDYGDIKWEDGAGLKIMRATTKQGVPIAMGYSQNLMTGALDVRCVTRYATTVLDPEQCGILIANQS